MALIKRDLDTVLLGHKIGHPLLHVIAVLKYLRGALELGDLLEDVDALYVRDNFTHLIWDLRDNICIKRFSLLVMIGVSQMITVENIS